MLPKWHRFGVFFGLHHLGPARPEKKNLEVLGTHQESADPGLGQGRGGAWDHRRCETSPSSLSKVKPSKPSKPLKTLKPLKR